MARRRGLAAQGVRPLLCAVALAVMSIALLSSLPVSAAARPQATTFYGIPSGRMMAAVTETPTTLPTDVPTDTPADVPTATPGGAPTDTPTAPPASTATSTPGATATPTGPLPTVLDMASVVAAAGWPQQYSNWCGIATVAAIAAYLNPGAAVSQRAILNELNDPANASIWSYPSPDPSYYGPYVPTNISGDFGTDPRALADGLTLATGRFYHAKVDTNGAYDTTIHIVRDLLSVRQPISVFVDHGQHSVIVSGVDATDDPIKNPGSITAIHVWDPGGGEMGVGIQPHLEEVVPINAWLSGVIGWSGSDYFKFPYAANVYQGRALDPDPAVGPYAYAPAQYNHLWIGHYVYLSPVASAAAASLNADWEVNQNGVLIAGLASSRYPPIPTGYTGATVAMPTNPPPPPPPVQPPKPAPKLPPPPPPQPTPTARPTLTATPQSTATATPTTAPTPTAPPKRTTCSPIPCALSAIGADSASLAVSLLLLLMIALWFPGAFMVARLQFVHRQHARIALSAVVSEASTEDTTDQPTLKLPSTATISPAAPTDNDMGVATDAPPQPPAPGSADTPPDGDIGDVAPSQVDERERETPDSANA